MGKQTTLTKAARDRECQVRYPGCSTESSTTVLAHCRLAGTCGMGIKPNDLQAAWACAYCHDIADGRLRAPAVLSPEEVRLYFAEGVMRTQDILIREGKVAL
ncbi:MAG TPA: DUF1364 domain-containing protein [Pseudomonas sp.]|jgi:polyferredoxin